MNSFSTTNSVRLLSVVTDSILVSAPSTCQLPPFLFRNSNSVDKQLVGVFVARPSKQTLYDMMTKIPVLSSYDNADQGFLNSYFENDWNQLPFYYNALQNHYVTDRRAWKMNEIKVIHYVKYKPWSEDLDPKMKESLKELHSHWWHYHDIMTNYNKYKLPNIVPLFCYLLLLILLHKLCHI